MVTFDVSIAFDRSPYLDTQIKLYIDTFKNKLPKDTLLHIVTNRLEDDKFLKYLTNSSTNCKVYYKEEPKELISRCKYLLRAIEVDCDKDYLIKMDLDIIPIGNLMDLFKNNHDNDILIQMENRRIIKDDIIESRLWRQIYRAMNLKLPDLKISYIENDEIGKPLFNSGVFAINTKRLKELQSSWIKYTKICEDWIDFNIHPNEFALTALVFNNNWKYSLFGKREIFNPIGHFRKGDFPSTELKEDCQIPEEVILLHWHKPRWLKHLLKYNNILSKDIDYLDDNFWNLSEEVFKENYGL